MFLKSNKFLYYLCLIILGYGIVMFYQKQKSIIKAQPKEEVKTASIAINISDLKGSIKEIEEAVQIANAEFSKQAASNVVDKSSQTSQAKLLEKITFYKFQSDAKAPVIMCNSKAVMHVRMFNEEGELLYENPKFTLNSLNEKPELKHLVERSLILGTKGDNFEIFLQSLESAPFFMLKSKENLTKAGLFNVSVISVDGGFKTAGIKTFKSIWNAGSKVQSKFFCGESIKITYTLYNAKGVFVKEESQKLTLGLSSGKKLNVLEYLTLNASEGVIDAVIPTSVFFPKQQQGNLILKGVILKEK